MYWLGKLVHSNLAENEIKTRRSVLQMQSAKTKCRNLDLSDLGLFSVPTEPISQLVCTHLSACFMPNPNIAKNM